MKKKRKKKNTHKKVNHSLSLHSLYIKRKLLFPIIKKKIH